MATSTYTPPADLPILYRDSTPRDEFLASCWGHQHNHRRATTTRVPRAVVHATETSHVVAAVKLAHSLGVRVSVRSGGHSWAAWGVRDDAVLLDLGALPGGKHSSPSSSSSSAAVPGIEYDTRTKIVSAPPSATGRMVNAALAEHGRMFAGGHCPDVGIGGFLLQGGMGWNCKNWGWACESIIGLDAVTADGEVVYASRVEHADLFWAARGAGPGFPAIVTRFHLLTRPLPRGMCQSIYLWPIEEYAAVLQWVVDASDGADADTEIVCLGLYVPDREAPVVMANFLAFKDSQAAGEAALRPLHDDARRPAGAVVESFAQPTSLPGQYAPQQAANPEGHRYCSENAYVRNEETPRVPAVLARAFTTLPSRKSFALYFSMTPTSRRAHYAAYGDHAADGKRAAASDSMALSMQSDHYFAVYAIWEEARDDERLVGWVQDVIRGVERHAVGSYLGDADFQLRKTKFWRDENAARLMEVRREWDPRGRICGFLDEGDVSGTAGLSNEFEWK